MLLQPRKTYAFRSRPRDTNDILEENAVPAKRLRYTDYISALPNELLIYIFSFLPQNDLYRVIRCVCKRWYVLATAPTLWRAITAEREVPTNVLYRNDVNVVTDKLVRHAKKLEAIAVRNCWGSERSMVINSANLCRLVQKCKFLHRFSFSGTKILSCKFFKLLPACRKVLSGRVSKKCSYSGPINEKQMLVFLEAILSNKLYFVSSLTTGRNRKVTINHFLNDGEAALPDAVNDIWENILNNNLRDYRERDGERRGAEGDVDVAVV